MSPRYREGPCKANLNGNVDSIHAHWNATELENKTKLERLGTHRFVLQFRFVPLCVKNWVHIHSLIPTALFCFGYQVAKSIICQLRRAKKSYQLVLVPL